MRYIAATAQAITASVSWNIIIALLAIMLVGSAQAQTSLTDGATPLGTAPGAPVGAFALSGLDNVNLYNGNLNFQLPLAQIAGRGGAGYTMMLKFDSKGWRVRHDVNGNGQHIYSPTPNWWTGIEPDYGPGVLQGRQSGFGTQQCTAQPLRTFFQFTLTRLSFTLPDGTEYELRDNLENSQGKPATVSVAPCPPIGALGALRGKVFVTSDGSAATFISNQDIYDSIELSNFISPSGYLMLRDGTRYKIDNGRIVWMRDRNGNKLSFSYAPNGQMNTVTDSLNRQVTYTYGNPDIITYNGFGGSPKTIRVWHDSLQAVLRPNSGYFIQSYLELFPQLNSASSQSLHNPTVVSSVQLPDNRFYRFYYNPYGELARVVLPTGGAFEYEYANGVTGENLYNFITGTTIESLSGVTASSNSQGGDEYEIYRRVVGRRVLSNGMTVESKITYSRPESYSFPGGYSTLGYVVMEQQTSDGTPLARSKHYYTGSPRNSLFQGPTDYSAWKEGKETRTDIGMTVLRQSINAWEQRAAVSWWTGNSDSAPANDPRVTETITTLVDTTQVTKQAFGYDNYSNQVDVREYDFGIGLPGALVRHTHIDYKTDGYDTISGGINNPDPATTIHIRSLPIQQIVYDADDITIKARTSYQYDDYVSNPLGGLVNRVNITGLVGRIEQPPGTYNPASDFTRGNVTKVTRWLQPLNGVGADTPIDSYSQYDIAGNVIATKDPRGNITSFDYLDSFIGAFTPNTFAFLTSTSSPTPAATYGGNAPLISTSIYDFQSGKVTSTADPNGQATLLEYNDPLDRLTRVVRPTGGGETIFEYGLGDMASNRFIHTTTKQSSSPNVWIEDYGFYDGLGRNWRSAHWEGSNYSVRDSQFDALGRADKVANPYFLSGSVADLATGAASNTNLTVMTFDALGRMARVTTPDGSHLDTEYFGNKVTVTDQAGKKRSSVTDGLGRLIQVNEAPNDPAFNYQTNYTYDVLGNLIRVRQGGFPTGGSTDPSVQFRRFYYDSLSRLVYANNPEQDATIPFNPPNESGTKWTMKYVYDPNGNLTSRTEARIVPASLLNVTTTYGYDALNRNTTVDYNDGTAAVRRYYDVAASDGSDGGGTFPKGKGRLRMVKSLNIYPGSTTQQAYSRTVIDGYDALGRITSQKQGFGNSADSYTDYTVSRAYDLASHTIFQGYPSTNTVGYLYGADGRLTNFNGSLGNQGGDAFAKDMSYNAAGQMTREKLVTQSTLYHHTKYNNRFQMVEVSVGTNSDGSSNADDAWNRGRLQFFYNSSAVAGGNPAQDGTDNNGNVLRQKHLVPLTSGGYAIPMQDDYFYDPINRLTQVKGYQQPQGGSTFTQIYQQTYSYDKFGNRKLYLNASDPSGTTWGNQINGTSPSHIWEPDKKTNRLMAVTYDAAGNMIKDVYSARTDTKVYDAENRMTKSVGSGNTNYYVYDGDGRRVRRMVGGSGSNSGEYWQVYGIDGELLAEYKLVSGSPVLQKEYGYRGGQLLVIGEPQIGITPAQVKWLVPDHLGTPRMIVDSVGNLANMTRHDYLPFGEELLVGIGGTQSVTPIRSLGMGYAVDTVRQKFGSKERDAETGLDFFKIRYHSSVQGRFTSTPSR